VSAPRHARRLAVHIPEGMTGSDPITDTDLATDGEDACPHAMDECPHIRCQRRPHDRGLCFNVRRTPYRATYWEPTR
jgi:hypothetical protein